MVSSLGPYLRAERFRLVSFSGLAFSRFCALDLTGDGARIGGGEGAGERVLSVAVVSVSELGADDAADSAIFGSVLSYTVYVFALD